MTNDGKCRLFQHTAARRRLDLIQMMIHLIKMFQHTAARRRLAFCIQSAFLNGLVSTHSRPKAAGHA